MERYEKYKDSGVEWIGEIPEGWEVKKIKYLATEELSLFTDGDWIESKDIVFDENQIRYITTGNIGEGKYKEQGHTYITNEKFTELNCTEIFPGDLLISRLNPPIGRSCILPDLESRVVTSVDNVVLRPNKIYNKKFLMYVMSNCRYFEHTFLIARGATMQRISRGLLSNVPLTIASDIEEQTAIANYLDRKTAEIDELIAQKERLIELYEEEKSAIINQAVTKGIDPDVRLKDSGVDWLGEIPEEWEVVKLKYIVNILSGYSPEQCEPLPFGDIEYVKVDNLNPVNFEIREGHEFAANNYVVVKNNAILFPKRGAAIGLNKVGIVERPICFDTNLMALKITTTRLLIDYLAYLIKNYSLISIADTSTIPQINNKHISPFVVPCPSFEEQKIIVNHIKTETARINAKIAKTKLIIELQKEYRAALISEVVTGKIKVAGETTP